MSLSAVRVRRAALLRVAAIAVLAGGVTACDARTDASPAAAALGLGPCRNSSARVRTVIPVRGGPLLLPAGKLAANDAAGTPR